MAGSAARVRFNRVTSLRQAAAKFQTDGGFGDGCHNSKLEGGARELSR